MGVQVPEAVRAELSRNHERPMFVYDLSGLREHAAAIRAAFDGTGVEVYYAAKANPDAPILTALAPYVDGIEVSSGGELEHVHAVLPGARLAFGGPGKTAGELAAAVAAGARIHVESPVELTRLAALGVAADVLLRVNPPDCSSPAGRPARSPRPSPSPAGVAGAALAMGGGPTPFGMDEAGLAACLPVLERSPWVRPRGVHAHLASGLDAPTMVELAGQVLDRARQWCARLGVTEPELNLGGGMAVDYADPAARFDWAGYAAGVAGLARPGETLRIEPGRAVTAYCGWYVTAVLDLKASHGEWFAVLLGGTQHLRTPVTKGHDQPFAILPGDGGPGVRGQAVTLVGQLCTPKDVFARRVRVGELRIGDTVAFAMAGAYGWNISHHDFLMHRRPAFRYVG